MYLPWTRKHDILKVWEYKAWKARPSPSSSWFASPLSLSLLTADFLHRPCELRKSFLQRRWRCREKSAAARERKKTISQLLSSNKRNQNCKQFFCPSIYLSCLLSHFGLKKGIVSRDFKWLQMILMNRLCVLDVLLEVYSFLNLLLHTVF